MLQIGSKMIPRSELAYAAFRIAFLDTRERLALAYQLEIQQDHSFGFLTQVPFLRNVPAQVQLELLARTWQRHLSPELIVGTLLDEAVLYACCETAAQIVRTEPSIVKQFLKTGPVPFLGCVNLEYADALQRLHLSFDNPGNFLLISQFQDIPPEEAVPLKAKYGIKLDDCECLFDILGQWYVGDRVIDDVSGLISTPEAVQLKSLLLLTTAPSVKR